MVHPDETFVAIDGGRLFLRDEGNHAVWPVELEAFFIAAAPVTNRLWTEVMDEQRGLHENTPVVDVAWSEAVAFCNALSSQRGLTPAYTLLDDHEATLHSTADGYRLPTEAEWEYAARAGSNEERYGDLDAIAWYSDNAAGHAHPVAQKEPNAAGLFDTIGNVWEWCWDLYDGTKYGRYRVFRGGGFADQPRACRASCRRKSHPSFRIDDLGFRLAQSFAQER